MTDLDKYRGTLLGLAIGDALGAPVEGMKPGRIKEVFGKITGYVDAGLAWQNKPYRYLPKGVYTDDTQQALCLAESLVRCYGFNSQDFARTLLELWTLDPESKFGAFRGIGPTFKKVMEKISAGIGLSSAGEPSAGIGAGMRVAPVGLYFPEDQDALIKASIEQALLTHQDPRALSLSSALAFSVACSVNGKWEAMKTQSRVENLIEFVLEVEAIIEKDYLVRLPPRVYDFFGFFFRSIEPFRHWQGMEHELVFSQVVNLANLGFPSYKIKSPSQNFALSAGITALFLGLVSTSFETGLIEAVNLGQDADSLSAMVGAILGARFGESAIPKEWREGLRNYEQIALRAEAIYQKSFAGLALQSLKEMEQELTRFVNQERENFIEKMIRNREYDPIALRKKKEEKLKKKQALQVKIQPRKRGKKEKIRREKAPWRTWEK